MNNNALPWSRSRSNRARGATGSAAPWETGRFLWVTPRRAGDGYEEPVHFDVFEQPENGRTISGASRTGTVRVFRAGPPFAALFAGHAFHEAFARQRAVTPPSGFPARSAQRVLGKHFH